MNDLYTIKCFSEKLLLIGKSNHVTFELPINKDYTYNCSPKRIMQQLIESIKMNNLYTCNRPPGAAGALIVSKLMTRGWVLAGVAPPAGSPTCKEVGCEIEDGHCIRTIHAEQAAIFFAAKSGSQILGAEIFSILKPCYQCSKAIIAVGIKKIWYAGAAYDEQRTRDILEKASVECIKLDIGLNYGN